MQPSAVPFWNHYCAGSTIYDVHGDAHCDARSANFSIGARVTAMPPVRPKSASAPPGMASEENLTSVVGVATSGSPLSVSLTLTSTRATAFMFAAPRINNRPDSVAASAGPGLL